MEVQNGAVEQDPDPNPQLSGKSDLDPRSTSMDSGSALKLSGFGSALKGSQPWF
jgi:hypothetical protein